MRICARGHGFAIVAAARRGYKALGLPNTLTNFQRAGAVIGMAALALGLVAPAQDRVPGVRPTPTFATPRDEGLSAAAYRRLVEADWVKQAPGIARGPVLATGLAGTAEDAAGGCDGVKDGKYGFHTSQERNPWWQVDLGEPKEIGRIVVFNRLDYAPGLHNADNLKILVSDDGRDWRQRHHNLAHFGGISGAKPLEVLFAPGAVRARYVRLQVGSEKAVFFHLDEVEIYGPEPGTVNLALKRPANQSSVSQWSTDKLEAVEPVTYPVAEVIRRGRRLAADLEHSGLTAAGYLWELARVEDQWRRCPTNAPAAEQRELYFAARRVVRRLAFANPLLDFNQLLFVKRFTQETYPDVCLNHMPWVSRPGGDLCVLSSPPGAKSLFAAVGEGSALSVRALLNDALGPGHVHGMDLWWEADRIVFGYAKAKTNQPPAGWKDRAKSFELRLSEEPTHLFEMAVDGRWLRQLTHGEWSDLDPTYLPNGDIAFASERCGASLQCNELDKDETSCNLYVMKPDGSGIRRLTVTKDGDYLPHTLDDGTIGYVRWEYQERGWAHIQSIWTIRPDGTCADAIFKQHFNNPWALEDARSIPNSRKLVAIATGHHTLAVGPLVRVNHTKGINEPSGIEIVTPGVYPPEGGMSGAPVPEGGVPDRKGFYSTPWALSEKYFLVAYSAGREQTDATGYALYLVDVFGNKELIYRDEAISCFMPMPLRPRPRPPVLPELIEPGNPYAVCSVAEIGRGVDGVPPEKIRYLRIMEGIYWPYDHTHGGHRYEPDVKSVMINWNPVRVIGTVPVEPDGSAHFQVPVDTAVYFQILDEDFMELRRMRSFISFQPGEARGCTGCHESRAATPAPGQRLLTLAARRAPSVPQPPPWGRRAISFLRDVQPVLDDHCVSCHAGLKPAAGLDFSGGLTARHNRAYDTMLEKKLVAWSNVGEDARVTQPMMFGSHRSKLIQVLCKPGGQRSKLSAEDWLRLVTWIDANAPYHDGFIVKRVPVPPYDLPADKELLGKIRAMHERRCAPCHKADEVTRADWIDLRQPASSRFLSAPLAKAAGGRGKCAQAVYQDPSDADYQALLRLTQTAVKTAWERPRRDLKALATELP